MHFRPRGGRFDHKVSGVFPQARDLRELVRYLQNAIAHFNIRRRTLAAGELERTETISKAKGG
jgi:hypothetical protein